MTIYAILEEGRVSSPPISKKDVNSGANGGSRKRRLHSVTGQDKKRMLAEPTSPENSKLAAYANAPSPRTLPRSRSRSSEDDRAEPRFKRMRKFSLSDGEMSDSQSSAEPLSSRVVSRPADWQWEYSTAYVGSYDLESRRQRIARYREKRRNLSFRKVRYSARSNICQKRERIGGRFVKMDHIVRADTQALMHPDAVLRLTKKKASEQTDLKSVAELMVELSKREMSKRISN